MKNPFPSKEKLQDQPGLFDELFRQAMDEKAMQVERTTKEIEKEAQKHRAAAQKTPSRPLKYRYHLPEYRQVKQYADLGVKLPASTINDCVHAIAPKLEPLYEALRHDILQSDYLQIDEVPWRIADTPGKSRKGYAWQFLDKCYLTISDEYPNSDGYRKGEKRSMIPPPLLGIYRTA